MLHLILSSFDSMPVPAPPVGYRIQSYQPGDHRHWSHIMAQSHRGPDDYIFEALIRRQPAFRAQRLLFCWYNEKPVGTAAAWYKPRQYPDWGLLAYLAVVPGHRRKGIGSWLALEALRIMQAEGRCGVRVDVDTELPVIGFFSKLGFVPELEHKQQEIEMDPVASAASPAAAMPVAAAPARETISDHVDYAERVVPLHRWHPDRPVGESTGYTGDARADESLYRPSTLGSARIDPQKVTATEDRAFTLQYRAGSYPLSAGARVLFFTPGQGSLGISPQIEDSARPGYLELSSPPGMHLETICAAARVLSLTRGENPEGGPEPGDLIVGPVAFGFKILEGCMTEGQQVNLHVGRESGFRWHKLTGRKAFSVTIDPGHGEPRRRLPEPVVVEILPLEPDRVELLLPPTFLEGEKLEVSVSIRDRYDNPVPVEESLRLKWQDQKKEIQVAFAPRRSGCFLAISIPMISTAAPKDFRRMCIAGPGMKNDWTFSPCRYRFIATWTTKSGCWPSI